MTWSSPIRGRLGPALFRRAWPSRSWLADRGGTGGGLGGNLTEALVETSEALASGDTVRLAAAIDAAEAHHLVVHAARMRIVLAQRTGDRAPLARARPVLERLGDRQFLRRLEEVQAALQ